MGCKISAKVAVLLYEIVKGVFTKRYHAGVCKDQPQKPANLFRRIITAFIFYGEDYDQEINQHRERIRNDNRDIFFYNPIPDPQA